MIRIILIWIQKYKLYNHGNKSIFLHQSELEPEILTSTSSAEYISVTRNDHSVTTEKTTKISANNVSPMDSKSTEATSTKRISTLPIKNYSKEIKSELHPNPVQKVKQGK